MTQAVNQTPVNPAFNYAGLDESKDYLPVLKIEEGKPQLVSFLEHIPQMQSPPFVYCRVHWNSEMGENGRLFQCFGGSCCEQVTWQKGWGGEPGKFEAHKARKRFYIPVVHYTQNPNNPAESIATVKYLDVTYTAYDIIVKAINNNTEGLPFFERDVMLEATKVNGATVYQVNKKESKAMWLTNPVFNKQINDELPTVAERLLAAMPKAMTETEFLEMKPSLDAKVKAAMASHSQASQPAPQAGFGAFPGQPGQIPNYPQQPSYPDMNAVPYVQQQAVYSQPAVNIPVQPVQQAMPVAQPAQQAFAQPTVDTVVPQVPPVQTTEAVAPAAPSVEIPQVSLDFDPSQLLQ